MVEGINKTVNRVTGHKPVDVKPANAQSIRSRVYDKPKPEVKYKFEIGQRVRVAKTKATFKTKGYLPNFSREIYIVKTRLERNPPSYRLEDEHGQPLSGVWYEPELVSVRNLPRQSTKKRN